MSYITYIQSILNSRENKWFPYCECHHIVPKCIGGTEDPENFIYLTYEEHYQAHKLLVEENPEEKGLVYALWRMSNGKHEVTPEQYAEARKLFVDMKRRLPTPESVVKRFTTYSRGRKLSEDTKQKLRIANTGKVLSSEHRRKISESRKGKYTGEVNPFYGKHHTEESKKKITANRRSYLGEANPNYGKVCSEEVRNKMRVNRGSLSGERNPSYGTVCINNGSVNKRIKPEEVDKYLSEGWIQGMKKYERSAPHVICKSCGEVFLGKSTTEKFCSRCKEPRS